MTSDPIQLKKCAKLSGIIMEINGLREFRLRPQSTQNRTAGDLLTRRLPLTRFPKFQRTSAEAPYMRIQYHT